ncbi:MAG: hypothetical protein ACK4GO_14350 [Gemmobacter sp.]
MSDAPPDAAGPTEARGDGTRGDRLKAALKANMARRKAQARARSAGPEDAMDGARHGDGEQEQNM